MDVVRRISLFATAFLLLVAGLLGWAYQRRIAAEERLLQRDLPGYNAYIRRTKKLIPFVW